MSTTVNDIQVWIANEIDQSDTAPNQGSTDWNIRLRAMNRSLFDWSNTNDWDSLKVVHNGIISTSTGNATYVLPANFNKLDGFPRIVWDGATLNEFPVVDPSKNTQYLDSDKFVNIFDNARDTKAMFIHSTLVSGASVQFTYWKSPQSLASATDIVEVPDPTYLVQRSLYYIYKGREDARFPEAKVEADRILARMLENENSRGLAYIDRTIPNQLEETFRFRIGRD